MNERTLEQAIGNIERLVVRTIDNPPEGEDVNGLVKDYNLVRGIITKYLISENAETTGN